MFDGKLGSISNKRFVIIRFRQIKAAKIQASLGNISYNENVGLSPMIVPLKPALELRMKSHLLVAVLFAICFSFAGTAILNSQEGESVTDIVPPEIPGGMKKVDLPSTVYDVKIGGDGRFILLHFESLRKIGLFDVNESKIVHYFPANDDRIVFDAGATKALIVNGSNGTISRYDLFSHERELLSLIHI